MVDFAHLHVHTDHSPLDGHASVNELARHIASMGQPGFAITDHGTQSNVYNGYKAAKAISDELGKPFYFMPGIEAYVTPGDTPRHEHAPIFFGKERVKGEDKTENSKDVAGGGAYTHLTMLSQNNEGMHNLFKLNSLAWLDGQYRKPRMDIDIISQHSKGIIATTGCPSGELQTRIRLGQFDEALKYAGKMQDIFGKENYFLELMDHDMRIGLERDVRNDLMRVAKKLDIPLLATNDLHYTKRADAPDHEHMLAIQSGHTMHEPSYGNGGKRFAFEGEEYYAKSTEEMLKLFPEDVFPGAIANSAEIIKRSEVTFDYNATLRPSVPLPDGHDEHSYLRELVMKGLYRKRPQHVHNKEYLDRIEVELGVLREKNFSGYMLVVSDFIVWAKANGILVGPGRGSGGGSLVAFLTDITEIEPIEHGLIFERFLNPERDSPPDIDTDFADVDRDKVIEYVRRQYGNDQIAMIITFGLIKAKSAVKDMTKILSEPYSVGESLTKVMPPAKAGREISLKEIFDPEASRYPEAEEFRQVAQSLSNKTLIPGARGIEGKLRQTGVHAAGVIMSGKPIIDSIPLLMRKKDGAVITQFDYPTCEDLGLIKMDFLGLRNLTVIQKTIDAVKRNYGIIIKPNEVYDSALSNPDPKAFELLNKGGTLGIFQLDSGGIASLVKYINVNSFKDISAILALYRPGPMGVNAHIMYADRKNGRAPIEPIHPELEEVLEPILGETYGLIAFQEQIQFIAQKVAGYSLGQADVLRRAMGKKKKSILDAEFVPFSNGMKKNGYGDEAIAALWETLIPFAEYGFNKSHSAAYGLVSYMTAYLKANYGAEFMAANLSTLTGDKEKTATYLAECRHMDIKVLPPDVSRSTADYTATPEGEILVGLHAIRGVGIEVSNDIFSEVEANGVYSDLGDFLNRAPSNALTKGVLEGLIHAGALDNFGYNRKSLFYSVPSNVKTFAQARKKKDGGQFDLFDAFLDDDDFEKPSIDVEFLDEYNKKTKLSYERHALGLYVSDHPLSGIANMLEKFSDTQAVDVFSGKVKPSSGGFGDRKNVRMAGVAGNVVRKQTKSGGFMVIFELEDISGVMECLIFPKAYERLGNKIHADTVYEIQGSLLAREGEDGVKLVVDNLEEIKLTESGLIPFSMNLYESQTVPEAVKALEEVLLRYPGEMPVHLNIYNAQGGCSVMELDERYNVGYTKELDDDLRVLFGSRVVG